MGRTTLIFTPIRFRDFKNWATNGIESSIHYYKYLTDSYKTCIKAKEDSPIIMFSKLMSEIAYWKKQTFCPWVKGFAAPPQEQRSYYQDVT